LPRGCCHARICAPCGGLPPGCRRFILACSVVPQTRGPGRRSDPGAVFVSDIGGDRTGTGSAAAGGRHRDPVADAGKLDRQQRHGHHSEDIQQKQERTLPEVLNDVPGLNVVQTGSPGGTTSVFIRGTNANHTKVLIDGIDASDPSAGDAFDFSQILASDIARVEVLRGPASGLYGSDAIGVVVNIITKAGSGPPHMYGMVEGGSYNMFNQSTGLSGSTGRLTYNFDFAHYHSGETDVTPTGIVPPGVPLNPDYYDNRTFTTKLGPQLTDNFDVGAVLRYVDTDLNSTSDDFSLVPPVPEAQQSYSSNHELFTRGFAHLVLFDGQFEQTIGFGYTGYWRNFFDPTPDEIALGNDPSDFHGVREKLDWQGTVKLIPGETLVLGAEHQIERLNNTNPSSAHVTNDAGYLTLQSAVTDRIFNAASFRLTTMVRLAAIRRFARHRPI
jgi:vitamin B12 transporter